MEESDVVKHAVLILDVSATLAYTKWQRPWMAASDSSNEIADQHWNQKRFKKFQWTPGGIHWHLKFSLERVHACSIHDGLLTIYPSVRVCVCLWWECHSIDSCGQKRQLARKLSVTTFSASLPLFNVDKLCTHLSETLTTLLEENNKGFFDIHPCLLFDLLTALHNGASQWLVLPIELGSFLPKKYAAHNQTHYGSLTRIHPASLYNAHYKPWRSQGYTVSCRQGGSNIKTLWVIFWGCRGWFVTGWVVKLRKSQVWRVHKILWCEPGELGASGEEYKVLTFPRLPPSLGRWWDLLSFASCGNESSTADAESFIHDLYQHNSLFQKERFKKKLWPRSKRLSQNTRNFYRTNCVHQGWDWEATKSCVGKVLMLTSFLNQIFPSSQH